jgi:hypothetical protein
MQNSSLQSPVRIFTLQAGGGNTPESTLVPAADRVRHKHSRLPMRLLRTD